MAVGGRSLGTAPRAAGDQDLPAQGAASFFFPPTLSLTEPWKLTGALYLPAVPPHTLTQLCLAQTRMK